MRFWTSALALFAAAVSAQQNAINIPTGQSTLEVTAGQPTTITWTNPSSGTVTIKLQQAPNITPDSGIVLGSNIPASDETFTFTVAADEVNTFQYTIEIIDDTNPSNYNFSPNFAVTGATGTATATASTASATGTSSISAATSSSASASTSGSTSGSASSSTATSSAAASSSASSAAASTSSAAATSSAATTSSAASTTTSVPNTNGAGSVEIHGGLLALAAAAIAVF